MATFTLTDLKNEVSKKYEPTVVENGKDTFTLQNVLQLPTKKRNEVLDLVNSISSEEEGDSKGLDDQMVIYRDLILATEENDKGQELLDLLGDNTAMTLELVTTWMEGTQLGEA